METKIEVIKRISVSPLNLHAINIPFEQLVQEKREGIRDNLFLGNYRLSGYHSPEDIRSQGIWKVYHFAKIGTVSIVIATASAEIKNMEMLNFIKNNYGFSLSRDNLFALWEVYRKELQELTNKENNLLAILAPAKEADLPEHNHGRKIFPVLILQNEEGPNYDWTWVDDIREENKNNKIAFAFFQFNVPTLI